MILWLILDGLRRRPILHRRSPRGFLTRPACGDTPENSLLIVLARPACLLLAVVALGHLVTARQDLASQHLVASALFRGHPGPVLLRRRPGRHLQLPHQLHDRRGRPRFPPRGGTPSSPEEGLDRSQTRPSRGDDIPTQNLPSRWRTDCSGSRTPYPPSCAAGCPRNSSPN